MTKGKDISTMKLTSALKKWMDQEEWKGEIQIDDEGNGALFDTHVGINNQAHRLVLQTDEKGEVFTVTLLSPFNVPPARMADMARILNRLNVGLRFGKFYCWDDAESNPVTFEHAIDVEGSELVPQQIGNMIGPAMGTFAASEELLAVVALTKQPIDALWANFLEAGETRAKAHEESGPSEL
jgi:hypothetical protein